MIYGYFWFGFSLLLIRKKYDELWYIYIYIDLYSYDMGNYRFVSEIFIEEKIVKKNSNSLF